MFRARKHKHFNVSLEEEGELIDTPVVIAVSVDLGNCKTFDMSLVKNSDYCYYTKHGPSSYVHLFPVMKDPGYSSEHCDCGRCFRGDRSEKVTPGRRAALRWNGVGLRDPNLCRTTCRDNVGSKFGIDYSWWENFGIKYKKTHSNEYPIGEDELGRLVLFGGVADNLAIDVFNDCNSRISHQISKLHYDHLGWSHTENGTTSWIEEGFDSQYVAETLVEGTS